MPNYRFYLKYVPLTTPLTTDFTTGSDHILYDEEWHQFYPGMGRDTALEYDRTDFKYRVKLKGELTFFDNSTQSDFTYLYAIESKYVEIKCRIEQICDVTTSSDWWEGYFSIVDGRWDSDRGTFAVNPTVDDSYRFLEELGDKEFNILTAAISHTESAALTYSTTQTEIVTDCTNLSPSSAYKAANPRPTGDSWAFYADCGDDPFGCSVGSQKYTFRKQSYPIKIDSGYVWDESKSMWSDGFCTVQTGTITPAIPSRGMKLEEVIQFFLDELDGTLTYKSTFFLNDEYPTGDARIPIGTVNYVTGVANKLNNILLFQKSDTKVTSNRATVGKLTFNELMDILKNMFNVDWFIDEEGYFRIEHVSYWDATPTSDTDLTTKDGGKWIHSKNKWEYEIVDMPNIEKFNFMEANSIDFVGYPIIYNNIATGNRYKDNVKNYDVPVTTEIGYIYSAPENIDNNGWVLLVTDGAGTILNETGTIITSVSFPNGHLSWSSLHDKYWRHNRVLQNGNLNDTDVTFLSWKRSIKQVEVSYPECCDSFDPMATKTTDLGDGEVRQAEYRLIDGSVKTVFFFS